jgi:hypothetical protein
MYRSGDFAHAVIARWLRNDPVDLPDAIHDREYAATQGEPEFTGHIASKDETE